MKRSLLFTLFLLLTLCSFPQYKISDIIDENKVKIEKPYKYDGFLMKEFNIGLINLSIPLEFVAFKGQKYKLIFCSSTFEEEVLVSIYDKSAPNVKLAEKTINKDNREWLYEPPKEGAYSIVYEVPPSNTDVEHKACMVMLIGFRD
ncbi:MAG: hypothetical protein ACJ77K_03170 [Bacteroidia bacterium]